jgi:hypothetical protein
MHCVSLAFGCPSLKAKGRRNRLTTIFELPRHQTFVCGPLRAFRKGVLALFSVSVCLVRDAGRRNADRDKAE